MMNKGHRNRKRYLKIAERILFLLLLLALLASSISIAKAAGAHIVEDFTLISGRQNHVIDTTKFNRTIEQVALTHKAKNNERLTIGYIIGNPIDKFLITRTAYQYFSIEKNFVENADMKITYSVPESWVNNLGYNYKALALYYFNEREEAWEEIPSHLQQSSAGKLIFNTNTNRFGYYVVADKDFEIEKPITIIETVPTDMENQSEKTMEKNPLTPPEIESPIAIQEKQKNTSLMVITLTILVLTLLGGTIAIIKLQAKDNKKQKKKPKHKGGHNMHFFDDLAAKVIEKNRVANMKKEINSLEHLVANKLTQALKNKGYSNHQIHNHLTKNKIDPNIINRLIKL